MRKSKYEELNSKEWLIQKYCIEELDIGKIALLLNASHKTVSYHIKKHEIKLRTKSELMMGPKNPMFMKHHTQENRNKITDSQLTYTQEEIIQLLATQNCIPLCKFVGLDGYFAIYCNKCNLDYSVKNAKNILQQEIYCKSCRNNHQCMILMNRCQDICKKLNMIFLDNYINDVLEYHNFQCQAGHKIYKPLSEFIRIINKGKNTNGCKQCVSDRIRIPIDKIKVQYNELGFEFLDNKYINKHTKYITRCITCGLIWKTKAVCIINLKSGCPECNRYLNEKLTGEYIKKLLNIEIEKQYCIKMNDNNLQMNHIYADIYFELNNEKYIVEYNGKQHYEVCDFFHKTKEKLIIQKRRDKWLKQYCKDNKITLIIIDGRKYKKDKIMNFLKNRFIKLKLIKGDIK